MQIEMTGASAPSKGRSPHARWLATASLSLAALFAGGAAQAGVILTDSFEGGTLYGNPPTLVSAYSSNTPAVSSSVARTGTKSLYFDSKEGILYTLTDTYQVGTYDVSYFIRREGAWAIELGLLTYGYVSGYSDRRVAVSYIEEAGLAYGQWVQVTMTATIAAGNAAIGQSIQLLIEQSRGGGVYPNMYLDDVSITYTPAPGSGGGTEVPEPMSLALLSAAFLAIGAVRRRRGASVTSGVAAITAAPVGLGSAAAGISRGAKTLPASRRVGAMATFTTWTERMARATSWSTTSLCPA